MTLNILFLSITIRKRTMTAEEIMMQEQAKKIHDQNKDRQYSMYRPF
ncbi:YrzI family small protein [Bacillus infantis]|jgi:uncharacterized protein (TIGR02413 family)|uniref:Sporulation protein n=2 Tax=Bacillus infantis TaxID=324767 RepID=U5LDW8_9BACI|nr:MULTISPECIES: YrzI family small protein [Bacillus]AGX05608.1 hypothetical protein N288_18645 [Bacillus infantis NRRL B-14911]EAR63624.1 hypothetical protein B14911_06783 [Bacillus sp. NRRL B-14911]MCA1036319.1 YrzI family small protein [Bacillus infantis]MCA1039030.1 YrzI family small protein [Bacillus infantis]MCK6204896.1 YrzI family small protein [Bacillus infantis]